MCKPWHSFRMAFKSRHSAIFGIASRLSALAGCLDMAQDACGFATLFQSALLGGCRYILLHTGIEELHRAAFLGRGILLLIRGARLGFHGVSRKMFRYVIVCARQRRCVVNVLSNCTLTVSLRRSSNWLVFHFRQLHHGQRLPQPLVLHLQQTAQAFVMHSFDSL